MIRTGTTVRKRTLLGAAAAIALSVSLVGISAGVAEAVPRESSCLAIHENMGVSLHMAYGSYLDGDTAAGDWWMEVYDRGKRAYDRYCHG